MRVMRWVFGFSVLFSAVCVLGVARRAVGHPGGSSSYWAGPYTPTRMEWLALQLNVEAGKHCEYDRDPSCISVSFSALMDSTGLGLHLIRGQDDEQVGRAEIVRAIDSVRVELFSDARSGEIPWVTITDSHSGGVTAWRCMPRPIRGVGFMRAQQYKTAQLTDVCDSLTRVHFLGARRPLTLGPPQEQSAHAAAAPQPPPRPSRSCASWC